VGRQRRGGLLEPDLSQRDRRPRPGPAGPGPLHWVPGHRGRRVGYTGRLAGRPGLRLHFGVDGWRPPLWDVPFVPPAAGPPAGPPVAELPDLADHLAVDCVVLADGDVDNNDGADYRLWLDLEPLDSHLHVIDAGSGRMGFAALRTALASAGITRGLISWQDNKVVDRLTAGVPWLRRLVWVVPGRTPVAEVSRRLADGHLGLKLHPSFDRYPADDRRLDPYLRVAARAGVPVTVHSAPEESDPDRIRRLAERFPDLPVVLYHTYLGPPEGRRRAARHARAQANLYLETSWCAADEVLRLVDEVGPDRVLFGSDGAVDGPGHFVRPNLGVGQTYNDALLTVVRTLAPPDAALVLRDTTRRLFRLDGPAPSRPSPAAPAPRPPAPSPPARGGPARRRPPAT
jgi:hypothetical protein